MTRLVQLTAWSWQRWLQQQLQAGFAAIASSTTRLPSSPAAPGDTPLFQAPCSRSGFSAINPAVQYASPIALMLANRVGQAPSALGQALCDRLNQGAVPVSSDGANQLGNCPEIAIERGAEAHPADRSQTWDWLGASLVWTWQVLPTHWVQVQIAPTAIAAWLAALAMSPPTADREMHSSVQTADLPASPRAIGLDADTVWALQYVHGRCAQRRRLAAAEGLAPLVWQAGQESAALSSAGGTDPALSNQAGAQSFNARAGGGWLGLWPSDRQLVSQLIEVMDTVHQLASPQTRRSPTPDATLFSAMHTLGQCWDQSCRDRPLLGIDATDPLAMRARSHHLYLTELVQQILAMYLQDLGAIAPLDL